jgi:hypothetical protein
MSIANKIRSLFGASNVKGAEQATAVDLRSHVRIKPAFDNIIFIESESLKQVRLVDVSYGGAAITTSTIVSDDSLIKIRLQAVSRSIELSAKPVHRRGSQLGLSFVHDSADGLIFLREIIENMKSAASMTKIPREMMKIELQELGANVWRGDGPTDVIFFPNGSDLKQKSASALLVSFRDGKEYYQTNISNGRIVTSKTRSASEPTLHHSSDLLETSHNPDIEILRKLLFVFCGVSDPELKKLLQGFAAEVLVNFNQNLRLVR